VRSGLGFNIKLDGSDLYLSLQVSSLPAWQPKQAQPMRAKQAQARELSRPSRGEPALRNSGGRTDDADVH
jgi:hypothetical protein